MEREHIELQVLGPVQAHVGGRPVNLGVRQQRFVIGVLALEVNHLVTAERLIDLAWPDDPPASARRIIHSHISRVRSAFAEAGAGEVAVAGQDAGYVLRCDPERVDAHRFRELVAAARQCPEDGRRVELLGSALDLWRGPALGGAAPEETLNRLCRGLEDARLVATEEVMDARLRLGQHLAVVDELDRLVADHPHRHRFVAQLVLALHRAGRSADALAAYRGVRDRLADELGLDPPAELKALEVAILRDDPALATPAAPGPAPPPAPAPLSPPATLKPAQLPADLPTFTGRADALARLLDQPNPGSGGVITAVDGMAGTGKTALAVHAAHRLAPAYPDGQLFLDLHGFTPDHAPVEPGAALDRLLRALGVPGDQIPPDVEDRAALYRSRLAGTRMLVLLDNARDEEHVRHLLPAESGCRTLITSRSRLTGLAQAQPLSLDVLPLADAVALLARVTGRDHPGGQAERAVEVCGRLPLAIQIVAARLRSRPSWSLDHLTERLSDEQDRLAELDSGATGVEAAFQVSYQQLSSGQQRLFRLLGLHPRAETDAYGAAALAGLSRSQARRTLEALVDRHLLDAHTLGRYRLHDLTRDYAATMAEREDSEADRGAALTRLFDYYTYTALLAMEVLYPGDSGYRPELSRPETPVPSLETAPEVANAWLDSELPTLLAVAHFAADRDMYPCPSLLSRILYRHLDVRGRYADGFALHGDASRAAERAGDPVGRARAVHRIGTVHLWWGRTQVARDHYESALALFRTSGDQHGCALILSDLAMVGYRLGRHEEARAASEEALEMFRRTGDRTGEARVLGNLGTAYERSDRHEDAERVYERALDLFRETGNRLGEAGTLVNLAISYTRSGRSPEALDHLATALEVFRETGDRNGEAGALLYLGAASREVADHEGSEAYCRAALALFRRGNNRSEEAEALRGLGGTLLAAGRPDEGRASYQEAVDISSETGEQYELARDHEGLGRAYLALGEVDLTRQHWEQALALFTELGVPAADEVRARLAELAAQDPLPSPRSGQR